MHGMSGINVSFPWNHTECHKPQGTSRFTAVPRAWESGFPDEDYEMALVGNRQVNWERRLYTGTDERGTVACGTIVGPGAPEAERLPKGPGLGLTVNTRCLGTCHSGNVWGKKGLELDPTQK